MPTGGKSDPLAEALRLTRSVRLMLESEARAGLAAVGRIRCSLAADSGHPTAADQRAGAAAQRAAGTQPCPAGEVDDIDADQALDEARAIAPVTYVAPSGLFDDQADADAEEGMSREEALARIAAEVASSDRCPDLVASRTHTVPGQGSPYARLMFIGEAPGEEEDRQGLAFVGRAGQLLTKMIEAIGMTRQEVFITNIVKCRPPGNRQPSPEEAANCAPYLARQIAVIRPKVIVALGGVAAQNLLQTHDGITRLRGRFYPFRGAKLIPTFHPAYVLRNYTPDVRRKVYDDLLKAKAELTS